MRANVAVAAIAATQPGIFAIGGTGQGQAAALNQDLSINSAGNAAPRGELIALYATGAGFTSPQPPDGRLAARTSMVLAPVTVTIGGRNAEVLYAGAAPGLVAGVVQVNARIPADVVPGAQVPVTLGIGAAVSSQQVFIAVR